MTKGLADVQMSTIYRVGLGIATVKGIRSTTRESPTRNKYSPKALPMGKM